MGDIRAIIKSEIMFKKLYPALYNYMLSFKDKLLARDKSETGIKYEWYALQRYASEYYQEFEKERILWQEIVREPSFTIDYRNMYVEASGAFPSYYRGKRAYSFANRESCWQNIGNKITIPGSRHSRT